MRPVLAVTGVELLRFLRDKSNIFFVFIFPMLLVLVLGSTFGGGGMSGSVAVAGKDGPLRDAITEQLKEQDISVTDAGEDEVLERVARGRSSAGLILPDGADAAYAAGSEVTLTIIPGSGPTGLAVQQQVSSAVEATQLEHAEITALTARNVDASAAESALETARDQVKAPAVKVEDVDEVAQAFSGVGQFDVGATSQLLLFVFLTSLAGAATLIQARREGVVARSLAAPVTSRQVLLGQAAGRFTIAMFQGAYIMIATALLFRVDWGNPVLAGLILVCFGAVAAGAAMVLGAAIDNEAAAVGVGVGLGLVLAGVGGGMAPLEIFSDTLRRIAHITPHAWAYDAFADVQRHDAGLTDILPQLGVLIAMAAVALAVGAWALRRSLARSL